MQSRDVIKHTEQSFSAMKSDEDFSEIDQCIDTFNELGLITKYGWRYLKVRQEAAALNREVQIPDFEHGRVRFFPYRELNRHDRGTLKAKGEEIHD